MLLLERTPAERRDPPAAVCALVHSQFYLLGVPSGSAVRVTRSATISGSPLPRRPARRGTAHLDPRYRSVAQLGVAAWRTSVAPAAGLEWPTRWSPRSPSVPRRRSRPAGCARRAPGPTICVPPAEHGAGRGGQLPARASISPRSRRSAAAGPPAAAAAGAPGPPAGRPPRTAARARAVPGPRSPPARQQGLAGQPRPAGRSGPASPDRRPRPPAGRGACGSRRCSGLTGYGWLGRGPRSLDADHVSGWSGTGTSARRPRRTGPRTAAPGTSAVTAAVTST